LADTCNSQATCPAGTAARTGQRLYPYRLTAGPTPLVQATSNMTAVTVQGMSLLASSGWRCGGWTPTVPPLALWGGLAAAIAIGGLAGLYPAARAARLAPTDALRTT
jgi:hypothetical protein